RGAADRFARHRGGVVRGFEQGGAHRLLAGRAGGKRVQAFGGAKNHMIVMPDADLDVVADQLTSACFGAAGQRCMAISVAWSSATPPSPARQARRPCPAGAPRRRQCAGHRGRSVINRQSQQRIQAAVKEAVAAGARAVVDRSTEVVAGHEGGYFIGPTVLADVDVSSPRTRTSCSAGTRGDAGGLAERRLATDRESPLRQRGVDLHQGRGRGQRVRTPGVRGMVGINVAIPVPVAAYAVQGWKDSAYGDTGLNNASWSFYTRPKYVTSRWDSVAGTDFGFRPN
ncbi:aldehyde dehydrogenase family protein, partial [Rhodococcus hoagii]|nr:aldehyde dehydrogenase family protein [Prescottella equi]